MTFCGLLSAQEDEGELDVLESSDDEVVNNPTTTTEAPLSLVNEAGPTEFYFQNQNLPKFKMTVESGIHILHGK